MAILPHQIHGVTGHNVCQLYFFPRRTETYPDMFRRGFRILSIYIFENTATLYQCRSLWTGQAVVVQMAIMCTDITLMLRGESLYFLCPLILNLVCSLRTLQSIKTDRTNPTLRSRSWERHPSLQHEHIHPHTSFSWVLFHQAHTSFALLLWVRIVSSRYQWLSNWKKYNCSYSTVLTQVVILGLTLVKHSFVRREGWGRTPVVSLVLRDGSYVFFTVSGEPHSAANSFLKLRL